MPADQPALAPMDHCGNDVYVHEPHQSLTISDDGKAVTKRECGGTGPGRAVRGPLAAEEADRG